MTRALIVIDVQRGFEDDAFWGPTANAECEANIARLIAAWERDGEPIVVVRHDSRSAVSPLHPTHQGNALMDFVAAVDPALFVTKSVNSAFHGTPDLDAWLRVSSIDEVVLCGIQTNMCVETTARLAGNLGYHTTVVLDATRTFDLEAHIAGVGTVRRTAAELMATTALVLQEGDFARVVATEDIVSAG
ncbi:cysteine hydrolase family protein [Microbacterium sp. GXF0217]